MKTAQIKRFFFSQTYQQYLLLLFALLVIKAIWAFFEISSGYISLDPDEAQYWTWSRNLDFGFYSKPPGIAWQIWLGCKLFGQTELGVRSMSILISMLTSMAIFFAAYKAALSPRLSFWAAVIFAFCPIGMMGTFAATTDGGFILFWTLALYPIFEALENKESPNYLLISLFILCGALFKWPIYLLWVPLVVTCFFYRPFYNKGILNGMALSLAGLLPSLVCNSLHQWPTFRHVITQTTTRANQSNFWYFFGAQFAVLSPILFVLLLLSLFEVFRLRKKLKPSLIFCAMTTTLILGSFLALSTFKKIQANWALYAYPTSTYLIAWYGLEQMKNGAKWLFRGVALSLILVFTITSIPFLQNHAKSPHPWFSFKLNPFIRSIGWQELHHALVQIDYDEKEHFLFSDTYQMASILSFYGPGLKRQYFFNTENRRQNQFCFWPSMAEEKIGKTGYYVWSKNSKNFLSDVDREVNIVRKKLSPYFESIELVKIVPLFSHGNTPIKGALIFKCSAYNGQKPLEKMSY